MMMKLLSLALIAGSASAQSEGAPVSVSGALYFADLALEAAQAHEDVFAAAVASAAAPAVVAAPDVAIEVSETNGMVQVDYTVASDEFSCRAGAGSTPRRASRGASS